MLFLPYQSCATLSVQSRKELVSSPDPPSAFTEGLGMRLRRSKKSVEMGNTIPQLSIPPIPILPHAVSILGSQYDI